MSLTMDYSRYASSARDRDSRMPSRDESRHRRSFSRGRTSLSGRRRKRYSYSDSSQSYDSTSRSPSVSNSPRYDKDYDHYERRRSPRRKRSRSPDYRRKAEVSPRRKEKEESTRGETVGIDFASSLFQELLKATGALTPDPVEKPPAGHSSLNRRRGRSAEKNFRNDGRSRYTQGSASSNSSSTRGHKDSRNARDGSAGEGRKSLRERNPSNERQGRKRSSEDWGSQHGSRKKRSRNDDNLDMSRRGYSHFHRNGSNSSHSSSSRGASYSSVSSGSLSHSHSVSPRAQRLRDLEKNFNKQSKNLSGRTKKPSCERKVKTQAERSPSPNYSAVSSPEGPETASIQLTEEQFKEEMYRRLRSELSADRDPAEREERIALHIREMAKLSPTLFREFMANNAENLSALALQSESPEQPKTPGEKIIMMDSAGDSTPVTGPQPILKTSDALHFSPSDKKVNSSEPETRLEKMMKSLRKGKEEIKSQGGKTSTVSRSYAEKRVPQGQGDPGKPLLNRESETTVLTQEGGSGKPVFPSAFFGLDEKEKQYEMWRATLFNKFPAPSSLQGKGAMIPVTQSLQKTVGPQGQLRDQTVDRTPAGNSRIWTRNQQQLQAITPYGRGNWKEQFASRTPPSTLTSVGVNQANQIGPAASITRGSPQKDLSTAASRQTSQLASATSSADKRKCFPTSPEQSQKSVTAKDPSGGKKTASATDTSKEPIKEKREVTGNQNELAKDGAPDLQGTGLHKGKQVAQQLLEKHRKIATLQKEVDALTKIESNWQCAFGQKGERDPVMIENKASRLKLLKQIIDVRKGKDVALRPPSSFSKTSAGKVGRWGEGHDKKARGRLCCQPCMVVTDTVEDLLNHLHTESHQQKTSSADQPWVKESLKKYPKENTMAIVKGEEFLAPATAFYCFLCAELCPDRQVAKVHLTSPDHLHKYQDYLIQHPVYENHCRTKQPNLLSRAIADTSDNTKTGTTLSVTSEDKSGEKSKQPDNKERGKDQAEKACDPGTDKDQDNSPEDQEKSKKQNKRNSRVSDRNQDSSRDREGRSRDKRSRERDRRSREKRSRSRDRRSRSKDKRSTDRRSRSWEKRSRSRDRRSRSRDRRSRDRRSTSRYRGRSRSRDRRRCRSRDRRSRSRNRRLRDQARTMRDGQETGMHKSGGQSTFRSGAYGQGSQQSSGDTLTRKTVEKTEKNPRGQEPNAEDEMRSGKGGEQQDSKEGRSSGAKNQPSPRNESGAKNQLSPKNESGAKNQPSPENEEFLSWHDAIQRQMALLFENEKKAECMDLGEGSGEKITKQDKTVDSKQCVDTKQTSELKVTDPEKAVSRKNSGDPVSSGSSSPEYGIGGLTPPRFAEESISQGEKVAPHRIKAEEPVPSAVDNVVEFAPVRDDSGSPGDNVALVSAEDNIGTFATPGNNAEESAPSGDNVAFVSAGDNDGEFAPPGDNAEESAPPGDNAEELVLPKDNAEESAPPRYNAEESAPPKDQAEELAPPGDTVAFTSTGDNAQESAPPRDNPKESEKSRDNAEESAPPKNNAEKFAPPGDNAQESVPPRDNAEELTPPRDIPEEFAPPGDNAQESAPPRDNVEESAPRRDNAAESYLQEAASFRESSTSEISWERDESVCVPSGLGAELSGEDAVLLMAKSQQSVEPGEDGSESFKATFEDSKQLVFSPVPENLDVSVEASDWYESPMEVESAGKETESVIDKQSEHVSIIFENKSKEAGLLVVDSLERRPQENLSESSFPPSKDSCGEPMETTTWLDGSQSDQMKYDKERLHLPQKSIENQNICVVLEQSSSLSESSSAAVPESEKKNSQLVNEHHLLENRLSMPPSSLPQIPAPLESADAQSFAQLDVDDPALSAARLDVADSQSPSQLNVDDPSQGPSQLDVDDPTQEPSQLDVDDPAQGSSQLDVDDPAQGSSQLDVANPPHICDLGVKSPEPAYMSVGTSQGAASGEIYEDVLAQIDLALFVDSGKATPELEARTDQQLTTSVSIPCSDVSGISTSSSSVLTEKRSPPARRGRRRGQTAAASHTGSEEMLATSPAVGKAKRGRQTRSHTSQQGHQEESQEAETEESRARDVELSLLSSSPVQADDDGHESVAADIEPNQTGDESIPSETPADSTSDEMLTSPRRQTRRSRMARTAPDESPSPRPIRGRRGRGRGRGSTRRSGNIQSGCVDRIPLHPEGSHDTSDTALSSQGGSDQDGETEAAAI